MAFNQAAFFQSMFWFYFVISFALVVNRLYVRTLRRSETAVGFRGAILNFSDAFVVVALLFILAQCILVQVQIATGRFQDEYHTNFDDPADVAKLIWWIRTYNYGIIFYYVVVYCIKGAILCFLLEVTPQAPALVHVRRAIWAGIILSVASFVFTLAVQIFLVKPTFEWTYFAGIMVTANIFMHVVLDLYIYAIPFFLIRKLSIISRSQKLAVGGMFGAGFILVLMTTMQTFTSFDYDRFRPLFWTMWWDVHELNFSIFVACLPSLRLTLQQWRRWKREHSDGRLPTDFATSNSPRRKISLARRLWRGELTTREVAGTRTPSAPPLPGESPLGSSDHEKSTAICEVTTTASRNSDWEPTDAEQGRVLGSVMGIKSGHYEV